MSAHNILTEMAEAKHSFAGSGDLVISNSVLGYLQVAGLVVPTDGTAGYAIGCTFQHVDGGNGTALYVNEGTAASCDFNAITVA